MPPRAKSTETPPAVRTLLLAIDSAQDLTALATAAELAARLSCTLEGVFVENPDLLRLAALPFAYEVSLASATARRLEQPAMAQELKVLAEQVRRQLQLHANQRRVEWSFRVARGTLTAAIAASGAIDIVVVGRPGQSTAEQLQSAGTVQVVFDGSDSSLRALETAATMTTGDNLLLLLPAGGAAALRQAAADRLAQHRITPHFLVLPELSPAHLTAAGRRYHCRTLVVGGTDLPLPSLLQGASCPVVVVK